MMKWSRYETENVMWISEEKWNALESRVKDLEYATKVYGSNSSYQVGTIVQMILTHLRLNIHFRQQSTELRSKDGPEQG
jgi:hypothetical protein